MKHSKLLVSMAAVCAVETLLILGCAPDKPASTPAAPTTQEQAALTTQPAQVAAASATATSQPMQEMPGVIPPNHPPIGDGALPPSHPPVNGAGLPPSHPPIADASAVPVGPIDWTLPAGWKQLPGDGQFRFATLETDGDPALQVSVVRLNGPGGQSLLLNVNRWESMIGVAPTAEADLAKRVKMVQSPAGQVALVDLSGPAGPKQERWLGAIYNTGNDAWSFLLRGSVERTAAEADKFKALAESFRPSSGGMGVLPTDHAPAEAAGGAADQAHAAGLTNWVLPADWTAQQPTSTMRVLTVRASACELIVPKFPKMAMNDKLSNINRWRGQVQLPPLDNADPQAPAKVIVGGDEADLYDFTGPVTPGTRLLVAVAPQGETLWFFKLLGPANEIAAQKEAFTGFLKSVKIAAQ